MPLDVVNIEKFEEDAYSDLTSATKIFGKWESFPISHFSHHQSECCEVARQWLLSMDHSQLNGASKMSGPRWINARFSWGPTKWPIHWCDALLQKSLDCGAQSALAQEVFIARGLKSFRVQLVQQFSEDASRQWVQRWTKGDASIHWIDGSFIYHECCAILINPREIKIWDGSASCWANGMRSSGYGAVRAVRVLTEEPAVLMWRGNRIETNRWQEFRINQLRD